MSVTNNKKTEQDGNNQEHDEEIAHNTKRLKQTTDDSDNNKQDSELMIEPKNEYDDDDEDDDNVEDLTMDDEMLEDLDQAGPSHGGEGSSQGKQHNSILFKLISKLLRILLYFYHRISLANGRTKSGESGGKRTT